MRFWIAETVNFFCEIYLHVECVKLLVIYIQYMYRMMITNHNLRYPLHYFQFDLILLFDGQVITINHQPIVQSV